MTKTPQIKIEKRKSETESRCMSVDHVVRRDVPRCNRLDKDSGRSVINTGCVSVAILYSMHCTTGSDVLPALLKDKEKARNNSEPGGLYQWYNVSAGF